MFAGHKIISPMKMRSISIRHRHLSGEPHRKLAEAASNTLLPSICISAALIVCTLVTWSTFAGSRFSDSLILLLSLLTASASAIGFAVSACVLGISIWSTAFLFFWTFMGVLPYVFFVTGEWLFGNISTEARGNIVFAQVLGLLFLAVSVFAGWLTKRQQWLNGSLATAFLQRSTNTRRIGWLVGLQCVVALAIVVVLGPRALVYRGVSFEGASTAAEAVIYGNFLRPFVFFVGMVSLFQLLTHNNLRYVPWLWWSVILAAIMNLPTSVARYYGFMIVVTVVVVLFGVRRTRGWAAVCFLLLCLFASPIADQFRRARSLTELSRVELLSGHRYIFAGHFDAFELFVHGLGYVEESGITWGRSAMGVGLFWVPRSLWATKPAATGQILGETYIGVMSATKNTNLSAPLPLEGFINFGTLGVVLFASIFGVGATFLDTLAVRGRLERNGLGVDSAYSRVIHPAIAALTLFVLRGSLLVAFAYAAGVICAGVLVYFMATQRVASGRRVGAAK